MNTKLFLAAAAFAAFSATSTSAQSTNRIAGVVRDETGGPIRGAIVKAETGGTTTASPTALTAATDDRGRFIFVVSRSGDWRLTFEAPGFDSMTISASVRLTGAPPNLDVKLDRHEAPETTGVMAGIDVKSLSTQLASAAAWLDQGNYDQAIAAYRDIRAKTPALTLVNLQLGNAYVLRKSYPEAETAFQEILKTDADDANGLFAMGTVKEAEGNATEAASWYRKASGADRFWTRPLMKLASIARQEGDRTAAAGYLARVIDLDAGSADGIQALSLQKQLQ
jgi:cytochrome c-type biogenesis protein CcmH/NrfG